jgi:hypothetical protein
MNSIRLEGIESLKIIRVGGNLRVAGGGTDVEIAADDDPEISREAATATVRIRSNASITVGPGIAIEADEVGGNLDATGLATPLVIGRVRGNLTASQLGAIDADQVGGNVNVARASAVRIGTVHGNAECVDVTGDVTIEKVGGASRMTRIGGSISLRVTGGSLDAGDIASLDAGAVGGRVRVETASGDIAFGNIGGKLAALDIRGKLSASHVGGRAGIARVAGNVDLFEVGGAVEIEGPFASGCEWTIRSRGRVHLNVGPADRFELEAASRWGRVRIYGVATDNLERVGRGRVSGRVGAAEPSSTPDSPASARIDVASSASDVIIASDASDRTDYCARDRRGSRRFARGFEGFAHDLGKEIPDFVGSVLDSVGRFLSASGVESGAYVRRAASDAADGVREAMTEVERAMAGLGERIPDDLSERLSHLASEIADMVKQAGAHGAEFTRVERHELRRRIREAAREMRDEIRESVRARRDTAKAASASESKAPTGAENPAGNRDEAILEILRAVKDGRLSIEEADELIGAWTRPAAPAPD